MIEDTTGMLEQYTGSLTDSIQKEYLIDEKFYQGDVKRGLRNSDGTGVLVGVTKVGSVQGYFMQDGQRVPAPGKLYYRGIELTEIVEAHRKADTFGFEEVAYLLLMGYLPTRGELTHFNDIMNRARRLPDGIIILVRDSVISFAVMTDTNACWLIGPGGKALERIEPAAFNENPHIYGLLISSPTAGDSVSSPTPTALAAALDVMKELDGTGLLEHIRVIDVEKEYDMTLWYDDRYEIKLGGTDEMAYKIRYLCSILDQLSEFQAGTIDLTQATQKRATFQPAA